MNVSTWSVPALPAVVLLIPIGLMGLLPDMDLQTIQVSATLTGAPPLGFELDVGQKIEGRLLVLNRLDHIAMLITDGSVAISASFTRDTSGAEALSEVRHAMDRVCAAPLASTALPAQAPATLSYTIRSGALAAVMPTSTAPPGIVQGGCPLAAQGRA
jgi:multidrug efflux pump subunit AcrB